MPIGKPTKVEKLPLKWGKDAKTTAISEYYKGKFTREEIKAKAKTMSTALSKKGVDGLMIVNLKYPEGWRSSQAVEVEPKTNAQKKALRPWRKGQITKFGEDIHLFSHIDSDNDTPEPEDYPAFEIIYFNAAKRAGGCDSEFNDCLYKVLRGVLGESCPYPDPASLKRSLKLKRKDLVPIDLIHKVEAKLVNIQINVTGDYIYTSTKEAIREINIKLLNGHYKYDPAGRQPVRRIAFEEKVPLLYRGVDTGAITFDGDEIKNWTREEFKELRKLRPSENQYILVPANETEQDNIEEAYKEFISDAEILKKESKGLINLYKTGTNKDTALNLFDKMTKAITPERISQDEAEWLKDSSYAALIFAEKYEGEGHKYDLISSYPSSMSSAANFFPRKRGIFKRLTQEQFDNKKYAEFGIYHAIVEDKQHKLFRHNKKNKYPYKDIRKAKELGLKVTLIQDNQPNFLHYPRDHCVTGKQLFGKFVEVMFELKQAKIPRAKTILNILAGALAEQNRFKLYAKADKPVDIHEDKTIRSVYKMNEEEWIVEVVDNNNIYINNHARAAPFILSNGRQLISRIMAPHIDNIVYCHTDGFISKVPLPYKISDELGGIKFEGKADKCQVLNKITVIGFKKNK